MHTLFLKKVYSQAINDYNYFLDSIFHWVNVFEREIDILRDPEVITETCRIIQMDRDVFTRDPHELFLIEKRRFIERRLDQYLNFRLKTHLAKCSIVPAQSGSDVSMVIKIFLCCYDSNQKAIPVLNNRIYCCILNYFISDSDPSRDNYTVEKIKKDNKLANK